MELKHLIEDLSDLACRQADFPLTLGALRAVTDGHQLLLGGPKKAYPFSDSVLPQICGKTGPDSGTAFVPQVLIQRLAAVGRGDGFEPPVREEALDLAVKNLNFGLQLAGKQRRDGSDKRVFMRLQAKHTRLRRDTSSPPDMDVIRGADDIYLRAVLTDQYLPISHLDVLTGFLSTAQQKMIGGGPDGSGNQGEPETNHAYGVVPLRYHLSDQKFYLTLVNPSMVFDLKNPDKGIQRGLNTQFDGGAHAWLRAKGKDPDGHWVFPAARIGNSETGHGDVHVVTGAFESACFNTALIGSHAIRRRHIGSVTDTTSATVHRRKVELVMAQLQDNLSLVFEPDAFEKRCRTFLGLWSEEVSDVKEVFNKTLSAIGMTDDLRNDLLLSYERLLRPDVDTLADVQRAITAVAQKPAWDAIAPELELAAGALLVR